MSKKLYELLDEVVITKNMSKKIKTFILDFETQGKHSEFLNDNLFGVVPFVWSKETNGIFMDLFSRVTEKTYYKKHKELECTNSDFITVSIPIYNMLFFMMHKASIEEDEKTLENLYLIFCYRVTSSLLTRSFSDFLTPMENARAVLESLSLQYDIKRYGTWKKVFLNRLRDVKHGGNAYKALRRFKCEDTEYLIQDQQNKLRKMFNRMTSKTYDHYEVNKGIKSIGIIGEGADGEYLKEVVDFDYTGLIPIDRNSKIIKIVSLLYKNKENILIETLDVFEKHEKHEVTLYEIYKNTNTVIKNKFGLKVPPLGLAMQTIKNRYSNSSLDEENTKLKNKITKMLAGRKVQATLMLLVYYYTLTHIKRSSL